MNMKIKFIKSHINKVVETNINTCDLKYRCIMGALGDLLSGTQKLIDNYLIKYYESTQCLCKISIPYNLVKKDIRQYHSPKCKELNLHLPVYLLKISQLFLSDNSIFLIFTEKISPLFLPIF